LSLEQRVWICLILGCDQEAGIKVHEA